jgi:uncharacterized protein (DUF2267 family)
MTRTGVDSLDRSIDKTNAWLSDVAASFGTEDRRMAYRVTRSWLHTLRDRLPVPIAAHIAAQLPELLRGVFYEGWNPSKVPIKYTRDEYIARFARDAQLHHTEVSRAGRLVTSALQRHISVGAINELLGVLPADIRSMVAATDAAGAAESTPDASRPSAPDRAPDAGRPSAPESAPGGISQPGGATSRTGRSGETSHPSQGGDQKQDGVPRQAGAPSEGGIRASEPSQADAQNQASEPNQADAQNQASEPNQAVEPSQAAGKAPGGGEQ